MGLAQFFRAPRCTWFKGRAGSTALQDWELQRSSRSYIGFIKLIKITPSPKWAAALLSLCCGSWSSQNVIASHNSSEKPQIESSCLHVWKGERSPRSSQFLSQTCCSYWFTPVRDVSVWVRALWNLLRNGAEDQSLQKKKTQHTTKWLQNALGLSCLAQRHCICYCKAVLRSSLIRGGMEREALLSVLQDLRPLTQLLS